MANRRLILGSLLLSVACGGNDGGPSENVLIPASIAPAPGASTLRGQAGDRVTVGMSVLTSSANPATRNGVRWSVESGDGEVSDTLSFVDGLGIAAVQLTLGSPGEIVVRATVTSNTDLTRTVTVTVDPAPTITDITPQQIAAGDTVSIQGTGLAGATQVSFSGVRAVPLSSTASEVVVIAPPCGAVGPVNIRVSIGFVRTQAAAANWTSTGQPVELEVGQGVSFDVGGQSRCADLVAAGDQGAEYVLTLQSTTDVPGRSGQVVLTGESTGAVTTVPEEHTGENRTFEQRFHDGLRVFESELSRQPRVPSPGLLKSVSPASAIEIGDTRNFRVCNRIGCQSDSDFSSVEAEVKYVGDNIAIYQDREAPSGGFTALEFQEIGELLDEDGYDVVTAAFGAETDVDDNGKTVILMTPVVNGITPEAQCAQSFVTGFFFGIDIDPTFGMDSRSNQAEIFYTLVPDPQGNRGCDLSKASVTRLAPVTFVHEFQHMISYGQHVLARGGEQEVLWLNEALSHMSEDLVAQGFSASGDSENFSRFASGNIVNSYRYLQNTPTFFLLPESGTGSLEERGAGWLFLRWLGDQYGDAIYRALVETSHTGAANIVAAIGEPFGDLVTDWFLSVYLTDYPGFDAPDRFSYTTWQFREVFASLNEQNASVFPRPYPVLARMLTSTTFTESTNLRSGSGRYFILRPGAAEASFALGITGSGGASPPADIEARAAIVRVK